MAAADYATVVQQLYVAYFGRPADTKGLTDFCAALDVAGVPATLAGVEAAYRTNAAVKSTVDSFGTSTESTNLYGSGDNASFVMAIYQNVLGRSPDADGYKFWVDAMNAGAVTKANVSLSIMAAAMVNTSTQGQTDAALITKKIAISANFTAAITTENATYSGDAAAAAAREMLKLVVSTTVVADFQVKIIETLQVTTNGPVGQTFTLTTGADAISGTASNDVVNGTSTTFTANDVVIDTSSTDKDVLNIAATGSVAATPTVVGFEAVNFNVTSFADPTIAVDNIKGATVTVNQLQAAGSTNASVTGVSGLTIQAGTGVTGTFGVAVANNSAKVVVQGGQASTINVTNVAANGVEVYAQKAGTTAAPVAISVDGTAATTDKAKVSAIGNVNLTINATQQVESVNLQGNGAAATFAIQGTGAATTYTFEGDKDVTVSGTSAAFDAKTVTDTTTAGTTTVRLSAVTAATDLTKIGSDVIAVAADAAANVLTTAAAGKLTVAAGQTGLRATAAVATAATNSLALTVDNGTTGVQTVALGAVNITNFKNVSITANDNTSASGTFGATTNVTASGAATLGFTATALSLDASAMTGAVTATASTNLKTIKTGSGNDTITLSDTSNVTIDGGAGAGDAVTIVDALDLSGSTVSLSGIEIIKFDTATPGAETLTLAGSVLDGKSYVVTSGDGAANDILAVKMDATTIDLSKLVIDTTKVTVTVDASAVNGAALNITGSNGVDTITGGGQADTLKGGAGNDTIGGAAGNDTIEGGDGDDTITGGAGVDTLTGGAGVDTFVFANGDSTAAALDKVKDFAATATNADKLDLVGTTVAANIASASAVDVKAASVETATDIKAIVTNGIVTLSGVDAAKIDTLAEWISVVQTAGVLTTAATVGVDYQTAAFAFNGNTYVVQREETGPGTDTFATQAVIELVGVTGVTALGAAAAANTIVIA